MFFNFLLILQYFTKILQSVTLFFEYNKKEVKRHEEYY